MSYQVLARKYRPQRFADMVGQEAVVRTLTNALTSGRVHHAYVFSGIRGIGKTTSARLLARALECEKGPTPDPCGTCPACTEIAAGRAMDAIEIDAASNRGIDEVKALIQSAQYAPGRDRFKIFIIDEFHMLTREAFNALLKTLEEPPRHVVFILATTELEKVPETILSRCLLLNFRAVPPSVLRDHLLEIAGKEGIELDPAAADLVARKAGGSVRDAQSTLDRVIALAGNAISRETAAGVLGVVDSAVLRSALAACLDGRAGEALETIAQVSESGADPQGFLDDMLGEARAALIARVMTNPAAILGLPPAEIAEISALAQQGSEEDWRRIVDRLIEAGPCLRTASEPRYFLEALMIRLAHLTRLEPLADLLARLGSLPDGGPGAPGAPGGGEPGDSSEDGIPRRPASRRSPSDTSGSPPRSLATDPAGATADELAAVNEPAPPVASNAPEDAPGPGARSAGEPMGASWRQRLASAPSGRGALGDDERDDERDDVRDDVRDAPGPPPPRASTAPTAPVPTTSAPTGPGAPAPSAPTAPAPSALAAPGSSALAAPKPASSRGGRARSAATPATPTRGTGAAPALKSPAADPLSAFRAGLPARLRAQVDQGLLRRDADGVAILVPPDRGHVADHLGEQRFHVVSAAADAFARPVPVRVAVEEGLLLAPAQPGELEGIDFAARRLQARAAALPTVRAVLQRFDGRVITVLPDPPEPPARSAGA